MATETIREFLVSLGYKQDEGALKKFETGISKATKAVFSLAAAIESTAVLVAAGVARFASNLESLYFASQRVGSSVTKLKALDLAARNIGLSSGEAQAAVEALSEALARTPGNKGVLDFVLGKAGLSVKKNADGMVDAADAVLKLSQAFKSWPETQGIQFAEMLGMSYRVFRQLKDHDLVGEYNNSLKELGRGGFDQAAEHAHQFMVQLRDFEAQLEVFGVQVVDAIQVKLGVSLKSIREWMDKNGPWLAQRVADIAKKMFEAAEYIGEKIGWLIGKLKEWDDETDGLSTKLIALAVLLKVTGAGSVIGGVLSLAAAFGRVASAVNAVKLGLVALTGYGLWKAWQAVSDDQHLQPGQVPNIVKFKEWMNNLLPEKYRIPAGILHNNPGNLEFRGQSGALQFGRFAGFASEGEGLFQLGRQLELFYSRGLNTVQSIVSKYAPPGENNLSAYITDVTKRTGYGANQALNLSDPAVLSNLMNAVIFHEQGYNPYASGLVRDQADTAIDYVKGTTKISQKTDIHVNGAGDAQAVADRVASQQRKVNADLARNFAPAVQ